MSATMIAGYRHLPGNHCGSTALRNLLAFDGIEISEEMALGLGAGVCFYYVPLEGQSPSRFTNGRVGRLEEQFCELTGAALRFETFDDANARGRRRARRSTLGARRCCSPTSTTSTTTGARPTSRATRWSSPATTTRSPTSRTPGSRSCRRRSSSTWPRRATASIRCSRSTGRCSRSPTPRRCDDPSPAAAGAIERNARQMIEPAMGDYEGLPGLRRFAEELPRWPQELEDWQWSARFCYQVIERRGTGGGNFRLMYSRFLEEAERPEARIAADAATGWTTLAGSLLEASEADAPDAALWSRIGDEAAAVLEAEERLWPALAA